MLAGSRRCTRSARLRLAARPVLSAGRRAGGRPLAGALVGEWTPVVLFAGQIRPDKRLDLAIEACALIESEHRLAVVGEDKGDLERCRELAAALGVPVSWTTEYVPWATSSPSSLLPT